MMMSWIGCDGEEMVDGKECRWKGEIRLPRNGHLRSEGNYGGTLLSRFIYRHP
jgi:hypothetical protein